MSRFPPSSDFAESHMNGEAPGSRHTSQGARMLAWRGGLDSPCEWVSESWVAFTGYTLEQAGGDRKSVV